MHQTRTLYVMISRTATRMAKFIRHCSGYPYNHVSLTLDPNFRTWYSFARYHKDAPFYSGFIREPVERFLDDGHDVDVRIFSIEIPEEQAQRIEQLFLHAGQPENRLMYNYFDAAASVLGLKIAIAGAYTCLSFTCAILGRQYRRIADLDTALEDGLYYDGKLHALVADNGRRSDPYFRPIGLVTGSAKSLRQFSIVAYRFLRHRFGDLVEQKLNSAAM